MGSLLAVGGAFVALIGESDAVVSVLGLVGASGLAAAILLASSGTHRVRYRPRRMGAADWLLAGAVLLAPVAMATCSLGGDSSLVWYASPLTWPALHALPALALLPLLAPVFVPAREPA